MAKKKLPDVKVPEQEVKDPSIITDWMDINNPYLWSSKPDKEDLIWWEEHFQPIDEDA